MQFVSGIFMHCFKRILVLKFSLSSCENMLPCAEKKKKNAKRKQSRSIKIYWEFGLVLVNWGCGFGGWIFLQVKASVVFFFFYRAVESLLFGLLVYKIFEPSPSTSNIFCRKIADM